MVFSLSPESRTLLLIPILTQAGILHLALHLGEWRGSARLVGWNTEPKGL